MIYNVEGVIGVSSMFEIDSQTGEFGITTSSTSGLIENELLKIKHRTYLWLYLIFDVIENSLTHTSKERRRLVRTLLDTVDNAYTVILERSTDPHRCFGRQTSDFARNEYGPRNLALAIKKKTNHTKT